MYHVHALNVNKKLWGFAPDYQNIAGTELGSGAKRDS